MSLLCLHRCVGHKLLSAVLQAGVRAVTGTIPASLDYVLQTSAPVHGPGALYQSQHWHGTMFSMLVCASVWSITNAL